MHAQMDFANFLHQTDPVIRVSFLLPGTPQKCLATTTDTNAPLVEQRRRRRALAEPMASKAGVAKMAKKASQEEGRCCGASGDSVLPVLPSASLGVRKPL